MFDLSFMLESMANVISIFWNVMVLPNKLIWTVILLGILLPLLFKKFRSN